jgi:hypothetical protein
MRTMTRVIAHLALIAVAASGCKEGGPPPPPPPTYTISGKVSGLVVQGIAVMLTGATAATTTTDAIGSYSFPGLANGTYDLVPGLTGGYVFSPDGIRVTVNGADATGQDFTITGAFRIVGTVSGAAASGVTVALSGSLARTTVIAGSGEYSFAGLHNGSYTVTPSLFSFAFDPPNRSVVVNGADVLAQHFIAAGPGVVEYVPGSARKVCQLTGDEDRDMDLRLPDGTPPMTSNRTRSRYGVWGADLGYPVEHGGGLYLLFGDTEGLQGDALSPVVETEVPTVFLDSIAYTTDADPDDCLALDFIADPGAPSPVYLPPQVDPRSYPSGVTPVGHGGGRVPASGFSANGNFYVIFARFLSGPEQRSVLARISTGDLDAGRLDAFQYVHEISRRDPADPSTFGKGKFINISPVVVNASELPGLRLDAGKKALLLFGSGEYRNSNPYLAFVPLDMVEDRSAWRYLEGLDGGSVPVWGTDEAAAIPLFDLKRDPVTNADCIGELSVTRNAFLDAWLMLYNCWGIPPGIRFQVAPEPWGPWSTTTQVLFEPRQDLGYRHFIHEPGYDTAVDPWTLTAPLYPAGPSRQGEYGGAYGPYVLNRFTIGQPLRSTTLYFVLSTWNPYQVVLMKSTLRITYP